MATAAKPGQEPVTAPTAPVMPASVVTPASNPAPAAGAPATGAVQKPKVPAGPYVRDASAGIPNSKEQFPGYPEEKIAEMMAMAKCYVMDNFSVTLRGSNGEFERMSFAKQEMVLLPTWFALQHPKYLIIKG